MRLKLFWYHKSKIFRTFAFCLKSKNRNSLMKRVIAIIIVLLMTSVPVFSQVRDSYRVRTVVIDPGHGGAKPGAQGKRSQEKAITLSVAKKFGKLIEDNYPDVKVIYTRTTDVDISLAERAHIANRNKADLFISIHANSHPTTAPTGVETFVMGLSESRANLEVAKKENADILLEADYKNNSDYSGFDPNAPETYVMLTMFQNAFIDKSLNLAQAIQTQYKQNLKTINRGVKQAELYVLYKTTCPSVLTEIGFISNPTEEAFMLSDEGQAKIAVSLFNAFMTYKTTEEGTDKIVNPVINIKGWKSEGVKEEKKTEVKEETPKPIVVEEPKPMVEEKTQTTVPEEPKPVIAEETKPAVTEAPVPTPAPVEKPKPAVELPPVQQAEPTPTPTPEPKHTPTPAPAPVVQGLQAPTHTAAVDAASYYTVQFLMHPTLLKAGARELGGISDFQVVKRERGYVYMTGRFQTLKEAVQYCTYLKKNSPFKDAWTTQYTAETAKETVKETTTTNTPAQSKETTTATTSGVTYRVQFCTATRQMKVGDPDLQGIKDFHVSQSGKFYMYTAGNYNSLQEAKQRLQTIQRTTRFKDAFVVAIYKGERITLERAAQLEKQSKKK